MQQEALLERAAPPEEGGSTRSGGGAAAPSAAEETMTIVEHLGELRRRIIVSLLAAVIGTGIGWFHAGRFVHFLARQVGSFVFFAPTEAFFAYMEVALGLGLVIASPVILAQAWLFLVPGLLPKEAQFFKRWAPWVIALFVAGMGFGYFAVYPIALKFFFRMGRNMTAALAIEQYLGFVWTWIFPFGLMFELPLVLVALAKLGVVTAPRLRESRKYFLFGAYVVAVFIAPSELVLQFLIALPLLILYELSIPVVARVKPISLYNWDDAEEAAPEEVPPGE